MGSSTSSVKGQGLFDNVAEELKQAYTRTIVWFLGSKFSQVLGGKAESGFEQNSQEDEDLYNYKLGADYMMKVAQTQDELVSCEINVYAPGKMREVWQSANLGFDFAN